jgi:probable rRNA maturation factor
LPPELKSIEVILVSRAEMARIHGAFLGDATETDVVTFPYGEIVVCPAVARDVSAQHGQTVEEEVLLYALHGLLHLAGFDDTTPALARKMEKAQTAFFRRVWKSAPE